MKIFIKWYTHRSPQDPEAIFSPIFKHLLSISQSRTPPLGCKDSSLSVAEECDEPDHEPCIAPNIITIFYMKKKT